MRWGSPPPLASAMVETQRLTQPGGTCGSPVGCGQRDGGAAGRRSEAFSVGLQVAVLAVVWWTAAVIVTLWIKDVLSPFNGRPALFPHSFLFTGILNLCVAAFSLLFAQASRLGSASGGGEGPVPALGRHELAFLLFVGVLQGIELGLTNKSLSLVSVSVNRMVMACCVIFQLITAICWGLESIGTLKWIAAALLVGGGIVENLPCGGASRGLLATLCGEREDGGASRKEAADTLLGWVCIVASVLTSANRWALTQHIFQRTSPTSALRRLGKVQMLPYITPGTSIVCLVLAVALEGEAFAELPEKAGDLILPAVVISLSVATLTVCELRIVHLSAATVMVVLAVVHNIPIILGGVIINHDHVYRNQLLGFSLCSLGAALYFAARAQDEPPSLPASPSTEEMVPTTSPRTEFGPL